MGCGSSGNVVPGQETANGHNKTANGRNGTNGHHDHDDLPTVVLPDTPAIPKPLSDLGGGANALLPSSISLMACPGAIAFEIPLEEFDGSRRMSTTPPPHLQRLLQPPQPEISLPDIEEKLAEAEQRRQMILQQRAASAQKRAQKMMKSFHEMDRLDADHEPVAMEPVHPENKHGTNAVHMPPEPGVCEDKNI